MLVSIGEQKLFFFFHSLRSAYCQNIWRKIFNITVFLLYS